MAIYTKLSELLLKAGLSEVEVVIYVELLKKPYGSLFELFQKSSFSKSTFYRAFDRLKDLGMVARTEDGICALSLKSMVSELSSKSRKLAKVADGIRSVAPFLKMPYESVSEIETFYTSDQIAEAYLFMSGLSYDVNLDFGDFENFVEIIGGLKVANQFRDNRVKRARNRAICTTFGQNTEYFCTKEAKVKYKNYVKCLNIGLSGTFVIFSDLSDYVLFNNFSNKKDPSSVLVKSKAVAEVQRRQFENFSQTFGNL